MGERKRNIFSKTGRTDPAQDASESAAWATNRPPTLGETLKAAREKRGVEIADVARDLRIRQPYLDALEQGRYQDLPGVAYASGFLRTYAEYLGVDPTVAVTRFKEESSGAIARSELYMPKPVPEGRIPGGAILLLALVLSGAIYGGWYYLSSTGRDLVDVVPPLPERMAQMLSLDGAEPAPSTDNGDQKVASPAAVDSAQTPPPAAGPAGGEAAPVQQTAQGEGAAPMAAEPSAGVAPAEPAPGAPVHGTPAPVTDAAAPPLPPVVAGNEEDEEETPSVPTDMAGNAAAIGGQPPVEAPAAPLMPQITEVAAPPPAPATAATGKVYGVTNGGSRIELRAVQDSWVEVRDGSGSMVFGRLLRSGDTYRVPDQQGLRLRTGNAGGLIASVDGVQGPPLGQVGQVVRDILLDPQRLVGR